MVERLGANAVPVQLPIGAESEFQGIVDLVEMRAIVYTDDLGATWEVTEIPEGIADLAEEYREKLLEDRKSTRLNSSHANISYAVFCLNKKTVLAATVLYDS